MAHAVRIDRHRTAGVGWGVGFLAGILAGAVAGLACVAVGILMHSRFPPLVAAFWSALVAGALGGLIYAWMTRLVSRPALALWVITLVVATVDSLLIAILALPSGRGPRTGIPIYGLTTPLRQLAALAGIGRLGAFHFPAEDLPADAAMHYVTAVAVSLLVPRWAGRKAS